MTVIRTPDQIDAAWLGPVLGRDGVEIASVEPIGTGQMSQSFRVTLGDGDTVVVKLASDDPASRATGVGMGAYLREITFYRELADRLRGPLARCHLAEYDSAEGWFTLVLEDVADARQGDQIRGCTPDEARRAIDALVALHAPLLGDLEVGMRDWLNLENPITQALHAALLPAFFERYEGRIDPAHAEVAERFVLSHDAWVADRRPPLGLVHGDFRLDNLLYAGDGRVTVVDWQTVGWSSPLLDVAYFLGTGLTVEDRRAHEEELVRRYFDGLGTAALDWPACWEEYRRQTFLGLIMSVIPAMVVGRTERGDEMFLTTFGRVAQQIVDLQALDLLAPPGSAPTEHLRPAPADEETHPPGPEPTWNESWYFDGVSDDGSVGVYVRLGRLPNRDVALYTACICRPGHPTVLVVDGEAPLPAGDDPAQRVATDRFAATHSCDEPLRRFRVSLAGEGAAFADPSAPLRGEDGEPVDVGLDLLWETDGEPYRWRVTTRYEIPCRVTGTIRVGDEEIAFSGHGQRDHSWGVRDWWGADWMWSAFHLADGTRTHLVTTPMLPGRGIGYVQRDGTVTEIGEASSADVSGADALVEADRLDHGGGVTLDVHPLAYGPLLLVAPDGRVTHFVRAMADVTAADGTTGRGWIEWNRNQPS